MPLDSTTVLVVASLASVAAAGFGLERRRQNHSRRAQEEARESGLSEPVTLHPVIDVSKCVACGSCVEACPEDRVLAVMEGHAQLVNASHCVGHGRCEAACPTGAITLVFGTADKGVEVPLLDENLQTSTPGIYVVGELGGFGLIRTAVNQGVQAVRNLARDLPPRNGARGVDVAIVGAGPAGIAARERDLTHVILDQDGLGGSALHYPRRKLVMTSPVQLPLVGALEGREISKEALLDFWKRAIQKAGLALRAPAKVTSVEKGGDGFRVVSDGGVVEARRVVLALGRRGTPRKLGVPGEDLPKVAYRLIEPDQFRGERVLVVGGGNSAVEAAISLAESGARTVLSYRGDKLGRVAPANQRRLEAAGGSGLEIALGSRVTAIGEREVTLAESSGQRVLPNDQVVVLIGGDLPSQFLEKIGVTTVTYYGEAPRPPKGNGR
jgi:thioredoxin reductase/Pyruvate/2-oxoacid:ferredoxin oxidoreductase delta subunit